MTDHIGAFDRLYSKLASFDNAAITIGNFSTITSQAITITKTSPLLNITDQASLNTFSLGVAGVSGDFFTDSQSGDVIIKSQSPNKRLLLGSGPTSDIIFDGGIKVNGGSGPTGWSSLFSNGPTNAGLSSSGVQNGFNFGWNVVGGDGENIMTYFIGAGGAPRLDICSWNGTTRTTTLSINSSGGVTFGSNLYPNIRGINGQVLTTNGSGTLSWQTVVAPGTGTVTSVSATVPSFLSITGSPITSSGTLALTYSGTALPVLNGGTGVTTSTGTGSVVLANNPTIISNLNTPQITGSGNSGDLSIAAGRDMAVAVNRNFGINIVGNLNTNANGSMNMNGNQINLNAAAGVFANGNRIDVLGGANCFLFTGAYPLPDATPSGLFFPYIPPTAYAPDGIPISFNPTTGAFTNQLGYDIVVTASYSLARGDTNGGTSEYRIKLSYGSGVSVARTKVGGQDWSSATFTFTLRDQGNFIFEGSQTSGQGQNFFSDSFVTYTYRTL